MITLAEIETAVDRLPGPDQRALLHRLEATLARGLTGASTAGREVWMQRLDALRDAIGPMTTQLTGEQILTDSRAE